MNEQNNYGVPMNGVPMNGIPPYGANGAPINGVPPYGANGAPINGVPPYGYQMNTACKIYYGAYGKDGGRSFPAGMQEFDKVL